MTAVRRRYTASVKALGRRIDGPASARVAEHGALLRLCSRLSRLLSREPMPKLTFQRARGYAGLVDPEQVGPMLTTFIQMLERFEHAICDLPEVMECHLMTGDSDYLLRIVVRDVNELRHFIIGRLSAAASVTNIRSSFPMKQVKYTTAIPVERLWPTDPAKASGPAATRGGRRGTAR